VGLGNETQVERGYAMATEKIVIIPTYNSGPSDCLDTEEMSLIRGVIDDALIREGYDIDTVEWHIEGTGRKKKGD
tara:strand:+ start:3652 stop:3876 length:225 start_codon:yes stop_codon:yes gene_type:complete